MSSYAGIPREKVRPLILTVCTLLGCVRGGEVRSEGPEREKGLNREGSKCVVEELFIAPRSSR